MMDAPHIQALVDRLLARDQAYRPLELLRLTLRLGPEDQRCWERGECKVLEEVLAGDPERIIELLRQAAAWAERVGLRAEVDGSERRRYFHNGTADRLARTVWQRPEPTGQGDLFLDNAFASARTRLARALLAADAGAAEQALGEMVRAQADHEVQADAEHLVGALGWLGRPVADPAGLLKILEDDLQARAGRFFGPADGQRFVQPFWRHLLAALEGRAFDPHQPGLHASAIAEKLGDWDAVIHAIEAYEGAAEQPELVARLVRAGLEGGRREIGLAALCQLCWRHPEVAADFLDSCANAQISRRLESFWDLEPPLPTGLFPAWLLAGGYALPEIAPDQCPDQPEVRAWAIMRRLGRDSRDTSARESLQHEQPLLFDHWLKRRR